MLAIKCLKEKIQLDIQIISRHSSTTTNVFNKSMVGLEHQCTEKRPRASLKSHTKARKHSEECMGPAFIEVT